MGKDKEWRFGHEIKKARKKFGDDSISHGVSFFDSKDMGSGKIVFINMGIQALDYIEEREHLHVSGGGEFNGEDILVAKVD